ncbi:MAG TPA: N-acetylmuramoyl-L-alanine amidase, partial [Streptomyces sp.]|nr:N-acetylmuramoyl-L-alanine amidase [Streptomyces sp.]
MLLPLASPGPYATAEQRDTSRLQQHFAEAAEQYKVPESVLLGVSYLQSRWDTHDGAPSVSGGYGPMHLTDARTALADASPHVGHGGSEDARGDTARQARTAAAGAKALDAGDLPARLRTAERAADLTGLPKKKLRESPAANVRGGAALLAAAQKKLGRPLSSDPADWFGAVAAFPGASEPAAGTTFADDVFDVVRSGEQRTTDSGQRIALEAVPGLRAEESQADGLGLKQARSSGQKGKPECPRSVSCEWLPAPYEEYTDDDG